jgi:hypothetical protein
LSLRKQNSVRKNDRSRSWQRKSQGECKANAEG